MTRAEYIHALTEAGADRSKWGHQAGISRLEVGDITLKVTTTPRSYLWDLLGADGEPVTSGDCPTRYLAQSEALLFAEHYVRNVLHPAYQEPA